MMSLIGYRDDEFVRIGMMSLLGYRDDESDRI